MRKNFCGWYFKCQSDTQSLAVIPATHGGTNSIQLITDSGAYNFTGDTGNCIFGRDGIRLNISENGLTSVGELSFGRLSPLKYDIMGPFRYVPFMECRHSVLSMRHRVDGEILINGTPYSFDGDLGYIEGDRGCSFPSEYAWTQCFFGDGSLMLSAADIPFAGRHFTGIICAILWGGKEYRLATYLGAKAVKISDGEVMVRQGKYTFSARQLGQSRHTLNAPLGGDMVRTIHESISCPAAYRFEKSGKVLFEFESDKASFEFEYGGEK